MRNLRIYSGKYIVDKKVIHRLVAYLSRELDFKLLSLEINLVPPQKIEEVNTEFLNHKYATDIITFNYSDIIENIDAEIFICPEVAEGNARKYRVETNSELFRLIIHGILHVSGFDDKTVSDRKKMKIKEGQFLRQFLSNK